MKVLSLAIATLLQIAPLVSAEPIEYAQAATTLLRKRSQVHKSNRHQRRQKGQENHQANLGLSRHGRHLAGHDGDHSMSHSLSMSMGTPSLPSSCQFCPAGLTVEPDYELPTDDGATCGAAMQFAATLDPTDVMCSTVKLAQALCCPPVNLPETTEAPPTTTTTTEPATTIATNPPLELCSCSPREYNITLNLGQDCVVDDLDGAPGIGLTFCFLGTQDTPTFRKRFVRRLGQEIFGDNGRQLATRHIEIEDSSPIKKRELAGDDIEIISIQFLEFDTSGELIVINQDDTYSNTTLKSGDVATFQSISSALDPDVPIEDQLDYLPGGVQLTLRGRTIDEETGDEKIVSNRITWSYTNACDVEPLEAGQGQSIGWATFGELERASDAFCPATATTTTTTITTPTTTTTEEETTTKAPETTTTTTITTPTTTTTEEETTTEAPATKAMTTSTTTTTTTTPTTTTEEETTTKAPETTTEAPIVTTETTTEAPPETTTSTNTTTTTTTEATETTTEAPATTITATSTTTTTTTTPTTTTEEETTTKAPIVTEAPIVTTEAPTTTKAPPTTAEAPPATTTPAMSMHSKSSKALFGKSCKGGYKSKTEKESPMPKAQKTHTMAKVTKESDHHYDEKQSHDEAVDSKSGKALVDFDAKAEKAGKAVKASGKAEKKSSKSEKMAISNDCKSGKGSKMEKAPLIPGSKGGKANRLFTTHYKVHSKPEDATESSMSM